jgi:Holliday junction resolvase RusA-like endonuclease
MRYDIDLEPVPASRPRVSRYGTYYQKTYRDFRKAMELIIADGDFNKFDGRLGVEIDIMPVKPKTGKRDFPKGDLDNYAKAVLDSFNGVLWDDDDQICELSINKKYSSTKKGSFSINVWELSNTKRKMSCLRQYRRGSQKRQPSRVRRRSRPLL